MNHTVSHSFESLTTGIGVSIQSDFHTHFTSAPEQGASNGVRLSEALRSVLAPTSELCHSQGDRDFTGLRRHVLENLREVLQLLTDADIPACVVGINALRYYGAGRSTNEWDICVSTEHLKEAENLFDTSEKYERAEHMPPLINSFRHLSATFKLNNAGFYFIIRPSSECFIDPRPEHCELSKNGIPYPQMRQFARALLVSQNGADVEDFIDGMDLDDAWGEEHLDFDELQVTGLQTTQFWNDELAIRGTGQFSTTINYRKQWSKSVANKDERIDPLMRGRSKTRWRRIQNDMDPRERKRQV